MTRARLIHCLALRPRTTEAVIQLCAGKNPAPQLEEDLLSLLPKVSGVSVPIAPCAPSPLTRDPLCAGGGAQDAPEEQRPARGAVLAAEARVVARSPAVRVAEPLRRRAHARLPPGAHRVQPAQDPGGVRDPSLPKKPVTSENLIGCKSSWVDSVTAAVGVERSWSDARGRQRLEGAFRALSGVYLSLGSARTTVEKVSRRPVLYAHTPSKQTRDTQRLSRPRPAVARQWTFGGIAVVAVSVGRHRARPDIRDVPRWPLVVFSAPTEYRTALCSCSSAQTSVKCTRSLSSDPYEQQPHFRLVCADAHSARMAVDRREAARRCATLVQLGPADP
ncbi:hypothetical protein NUW54_g1207 [Trametes sanguinea]|uniref:Uncharacterized protein n=1 Tax=Trametes sanguinea TaxID=158606 RepID=A0ACC1Q8W7_9APHY|nr:hypothetical protein NUW54_g1207 [Trametes sanguinea]